MQENWIMATKCPDCGKLLKPLQTTCLCGWTEKVIEQAQKPSRLCGKQDCKELGRFSKNIKGEGPWYCAEHYWNE